MKMLACLHVYTMRLYASFFCALLSYYHRGMEVRFTKSRAAFTTAITIMGVMGVTSTIMEGMEGKSEASAWGARTFPHVFDFLGHFKLLLKMSRKWFFATNPKTFHGERK